jgi:ubiquinone/menaquinone biosynthesis C-methylase UbiE
MNAGYATDLAYVLTAIWESFPPRRVVRWWAQRRYRGLASRYDGQVIAQHAGYSAPLVAALGHITDAPRRILDVGTGTGFAARTAAEAFPSAMVIGCDLSREMLERARARPGRVALVRCDGTKLPFRRASFDLVIVNNAPPPIRELARMIRPGGAIVIGLSSGARLPEWAIARLSGKLRALGCAEVVFESAGDGLYVLARKGADAAA